MSRCVAALRRCVLDWLLDLVRDVKHEEAWAALPQRIILIRHGQAEHNLEEGAVRLALRSTTRRRQPCAACAARPLARPACCIPAAPLAAPALALGRTLAISRPEVCSSHTPAPRLGQILHEDNPNRKADNLCELTKLGQRQGREAGRRVRRLLGDGARISAVVSPFERTQQTLYCMQQELQDEDGRGVRVRYVHVDPRVREQEFGNFQAREDMQLHRETASEVGRFWYRLTLTLTLTLTVAVPLKP